MTLLVATGPSGPSQTAALSALAAAGYDLSNAKQSETITNEDVLASSGVVVLYTAPTTPLTALPALSGGNGPARRLFTMSRANAWITHLKISTQGAQAAGVRNIYVRPEGEGPLGASGDVEMLTSTGSLQYLRDSICPGMVRYTQSSASLPGQIHHGLVPVGGTLNGGGTAQAPIGYAFWVGDTDAPSIGPALGDFARKVALLTLGDPSLHEDDGGTTPTGYLLDHQFAGVTGSVYNGDAEFTTVPGVAQATVARTTYAKAVLFDGEVQSIIEHPFDAAVPAATAVTADVVLHIRGSVSKLGEVLQFRTGAARGPAIAITETNRMRLLRLSGTTGTSADTGAVAIPGGASGFPRLQLTAQGNNLTARLYSNYADANPVETLVSTTSDPVDLTALRVGNITKTGIGEINLHVLAVRITTGTDRPGPMVWDPLPVEPPQAIATGPVGGVEPWSEFGVTGRAVQETSPIASTTWAPAPGSPLTLKAGGSSLTATFVAHGALEVEEASADFTVTDDQGRSDTTRVAVSVLPGDVVVGAPGGRVAVQRSRELPVIVIPEEPEEPTETPIEAPSSFSFISEPERIRTDWNDVPAPANNFGRYELQHDDDTDLEGRPIISTQFASNYTLDTTAIVDRWFRVRAVSTTGLAGPWSAVQGPVKPLPKVVVEEPTDPTDPEIPTGARGRTAAELPFTSTSIWNLPAPVNPQLEPTTGPMTVNLRQAKGYANQGEYGHGIFFASFADPICQITDTNDRNRNTSGYIPLSVVAASGTDGHAHVVQPDGKTILEMIKFRRTSDTSATVNRVHKVNLRGNGLGPANGVRAYGGSAIGGLIRKWMVNEKIMPTAVAWALGWDQLKHMPDPTRSDPWGYYTDGVTNQTSQPGWPTGSPRYGMVDGRRGAGFIRRKMAWPVTEEDYTAPGNYRGQIPMGAYLLIPQSVDPSPLNLQPATRVVFDAMQRCGGYVVDTTAGGNLAAVYVEIGASRDFWRTLVGPSYDGAEVQKLIRVMRVVVGSSNTAATPNGAPLGAARVAPLLPEVS